MSEHKGIFETTKGSSINYDRRTVCEVLRSLMDEAVVGLTGKDDALLARITPLIEEAYLMGIKLVVRLVEQKIQDSEWPFEYRTVPPEEREKREALLKERVRLRKILEAEHE